MHRRPLPEWTPLALAGIALIAIPLLFAVPRTSQRADTILEALPFVLAGAGLLSIPFTQRGRLRAVGIAALVLVVSAPVWWFFVLGLAEEVGAKPAEVLFTVRVVPEDEDASYDLLLPLPLDAQGQVSPALLAIPEWEQRVSVEDVNGTPMLRVRSEGTLERTYRHEYAGDTEEWMRFSWAQPPWADPSPLAIEEATTPTPLSVTLAHEGRSRLCGGTLGASGVITPGTPGWLRIHGGIACA